MKRNRYYRRLDYIRIFSCLMVFLYHLNIIKGGFLIVCIFFVLTGYLECIKALNMKKFSIKDYYIKRLKRLYLPLLFVVSITVIVFKLVDYVNWLNLKPEVISSVFGYNNFWQLKANLNYFTKNVSSPLIHIWYISILMQFDLIFPLLFVLFKKIEKKNKKYPIIIISILVFISTGLFVYESFTQNIMIVYYNSLLRSFSIIWGILLALIHLNYGVRTLNIFKNHHGIIFGVYLLVLFILCLFISDVSIFYGLFMVLVSLIGLRLIDYSITKKKEKKNSFISYLSNVTYEVYLVQLPVIFFIQNLDINNSIKLPIIILLTIIISLVIYQILNIKPSNKIYKSIKNIFVSLIIIIGGIIVLVEKDNSKEMKMLEDKLNDNMKIMEQKNKEYMNTRDNEEAKWDKMLEDLDREEDEVVSEKVRNLNIVGVGDSVFLDSVPSLYDMFPNGFFDGKVSRSILGGIDVLRDLKNKGRLSNVVVLSLATNSDYVESWIDTVMDILGDREVYWINAVGGDDPTFNRKFEKYKSKHSNIHIVDWEAAARGHKDYFYVDGIHPNEKGVKVYTKTIYDTIYKNYLEEYRKKKKEILMKKENEEKKKIAFYGNGALINCYDFLMPKYKNASFNAISDFNFNKLYSDVSKKISDKKLEHRIVFVFDSEANISNEEYVSLIKLCKDYDIYIINVNDKKFSLENEDASIINYYDKIKDNKDYFVADKIHLSEKGNKLLSNEIFNTLKE